jgi:transcription elongation factor Elf1
MNAEFECLYCGHKWTDYIWGAGAVKDKQCPHCKDRKLRVRDIDKKNNDPFGYTYDPKTGKKAT